MEGLKQRRPQQHLRRDRGAADRRIERGELRVEPTQRRIGQRPRRPKRMVLRDPLLKPHIAEKFARSAVRAAHADPSFRLRASESQNHVEGGLFSSLLASSTPDESPGSA
jgi:hypothetical protein